MNGSRGPRRRFVRRSTGVIGRFDRRSCVSRRTRRVDQDRSRSTCVVRLVRPARQSAHGGDSGHLLLACDRAPVSVRTVVDRWRRDPSGGACATGPARTQRPLVARRSLPSERITLAPAVEFQPSSPIASSVSTADSRRVSPRRRSQPIVVRPLQSSSAVVLPDSSAPLVSPRLAFSVVGWSYR